MSDAAEREGLLVRVEPRVWTVEVDGAEVPCSLKPSLFAGASRQKNRVAVGDRVRVTLEGGRGTITEVLPRRNRLARPTPSDPSVLQVTAANVDQLLIVVATQDPPPRRGLIDRFLVAAESNDMDAALLLNKVDAGPLDAVRAELAVYPRIGYPLLEVSARTGAGLDALREAMRAKTSLFVGHSGVGKTSLMNALDPGLGLRVGDLARHGRGRHTTTHVSLYRLANGGHVIDSPGIRGFGLADVPDAELAILMPDLRPHATDCRYPDCTHDHEPKCGVRAALERGDLDAERYASYLRMLKSLDDD